jgi:hypothetical protein
LTACNEQKQETYDSNQQTIDSISEPITEPVPKKFESITSEEVDKKFPFATATEGLDIAENRSAYEQSQYVVLIYAEKAYVKVDGSIKKLGFKFSSENGSLRTDTYENSQYTLVLHFNSIKNKPNAPMDGWSIVEGDVELTDNNGNNLQEIKGFYAEGF